MQSPQTLVIWAFLLNFVRVRSVQTKIEKEKEMLACRAQGRYINKRKKSPSKSKTMYYLDIYNLMKINCNVVQVSTIIVLFTFHFQKLCRVRFLDWIHERNIQNGI